MKLISRAQLRKIRLAFLVTTILTVGYASGGSVRWVGNGEWVNGNWSQCVVFQGCFDSKPGANDSASLGANSAGKRILLQSDETVGSINIHSPFLLVVDGGSLTADGMWRTDPELFDPTIWELYGSSISDGGGIAGHGTLTFESHPNSDKTLANSGRIAAENGILTLSAPENALDLDGPNHTGVLDVNDFGKTTEPPNGVTLRVQGAVEPFAGELWIGQSDTAEFGSLVLGDESAGATVQFRPLQTPSTCSGLIKGGDCFATLATTELRIDHPDTLIHVDEIGHASSSRGGGTAVVTGDVDFVAGTLDVDAGANIRFDDNVHFRANTNTNIGGRVQLQSTATIENGANINGGGTLVVDVGGGIDVISAPAIDAFVVNNGLIDLQPNTAGAELTVSVFDQNATGTILFDLERPLPNSYDQLHVTDTATLDGTATINHVGLNPLAEGDEFTVVDATNGITGQFETLNLPSLEAGLQWKTLYSQNSFKLVVERVGVTGDFDQDGSFTCADINALSLEIIAGSTDASFDLNADGQVTIADQDVWLDIAAAAELSSFDPFFVGDVDLDSAVDSTDLGLLLNNFGDATGLPYCSGNLNADMAIDSTDLGLLLNNFGEDADPPALAQAVPEPQLVLLSWLLMIAAVLQAKRKQ